MVIYTVFRELLLFKVRYYFPKVMERESGKIELESNHVPYLTTTQAAPSLPRPGIEIHGRQWHQAVGRGAGLTVALVRAQRCLRTRKTILRVLIHTLGRKTAWERYAAEGQKRQRYVNKYNTYLCLNFKETKSLQQPETLDLKVKTLPASQTAPMRSKLFWPRYQQFHNRLSMV